MFNFEINGDELRLRPVDPFGDGNQLIIYLDKYDGEKWQPLVYPSLYASEVDTYEKTIAALERCYQDINVKLEQMYGKDTTVPESGFALVRYLLEKQTKVDDIKLTL